MERKDGHDKEPMEFAMPLAVATNFKINGADYLIPMCIEESSVVAAASNGARLLRAGRGIVSRLESGKIVAEAFVQTDDISSQIAVASVFAQVDPYRASTHNKGIMNGIDAMVFAIGGDISEVEAIIHSYASRDGVYRGLSTWTVQEGRLVGGLNYLFLYSTTVSIQ